jgi:hypothetical protein
MLPGALRLGFRALRLGFRALTHGLVEQRGAGDGGVERLDGTGNADAVMREGEGFGRETRAFVAD